MVIQRGELAFIGRADSSRDLPLPALPAFC
jgi:hypothetical protein